MIRVECDCRACRVREQLQDTAIRLSRRHLLQSDRDNLHSVVAAYNLITAQQAAIEEQRTEIKALRAIRPN